MAAKPNLTARPCGFTLIEMLVAITILAVIALISWRGLDGIYRARAAVSAEIAEQRGLQAAFTQMETDLRSIARDPGAASTLPGLRFGPGELLLLRQAPTVETGALRYQLIRYRLQNDVLTRVSRTVETPQEINALLTTGDWASVPGAATVEQPLARQLAVLSFKMWTKEGWKSPQETDASVLAQAVPLAAPRVIDPAAVQLVAQAVNGEFFTRNFLIRD